MNYSRELINQLVSQVDMLALVRQYVEKLENRSGRWWACCPFHNEKTPSFTIDLDRRTYYCFGCQAKGNAIGLVMELERSKFPDAVRKLAEQNNFALPVKSESDAQVAAREAAEKKRAALYKIYDMVHKSFRQNLRSERGGMARDYLQQRSIREETVELFGLGYAVNESKYVYQWLRRQNFSRELLAESGLFSQRREEACLFWGRLIFPVFDTKGQVIAFSGRILNEDGDESRHKSRNAPKYINSRQSPIYRKRQSIFGLYQSIKTLRKERSAILCEGNLDVLAFHQAGISKAVAPLGTAFTAEQAELLKTYCDSVVLALDGDEAGQTAVYKAAFLLEQKEIDSAVISFGAGSDPADILQKEGESALQQCAASAFDFFSFLKQDLTQRFALDELGGVNQALRFLAPYVSQVREGLRRELYIAQFAKLFNLKQEVLAKEASWQYKPALEPSSWESNSRQQGPAKQSQRTAKQQPQGENRAAAQKIPQQKSSNSVVNKDQNAVEVAEREFWASMLLQADLYPKWQEPLAAYSWGSADALLIKRLLDRAVEQEELNFETLCDRVSRAVPALGQWLLQKRLEPLQGGNIKDSEGYNITEYRNTVLEQKFCGLRVFWLRQRKTKVLKQICRLEEQDSEPNLVQELLRESQNLDSQLIEARQLAEVLQQRLQQSAKAASVIARA